MCIKYAYFAEFIYTAINTINILLQKHAFLHLLRNIFFYIFKKWFFISNSIKLLQNLKTISKYVIITIH